MASRIASEVDPSPVSMLPVDDDVQLSA